MSKYNIIRVDDEVYQFLKAESMKRAMPFTTPNNVLRIILGLEKLKGTRHEEVSKM